MFILRVITLANPNKIFFPAGLFLVVCGIALTIRNLILFAQFPAARCCSSLEASTSYSFGLILDQFASLRLQDRD